MTSRQPSRRKLEAQAALDLVAIIRACADAGFSVEIEYVSTHSVHGRVQLREHLQYGLGPSMAGSFWVTTSGYGARREDISVAGVAIPIAIGMWGESFRRFETNDHPGNDPAATAVWLERARVERERQAEYGRQLDARVDARVNTVPSGTV